MNFAEAFAKVRLSRLYPGSKVEVLRNPWDEHYRVSFTLSSRDVALAAVDPMRAAKKLNECLTPRPTVGRHWSLLPRKRR